MTAQATENFELDDKITLEEDVGYDICNYVVIDYSTMSFTEAEYTLIKVHYQSEGNVEKIQSYKYLPGSNDRVQPQQNDYTGMQNIVSPIEPMCRSDSDYHSKVTMKK